MAISQRPRYYQVGSYGKYALYPVTTEREEEAPATFTFDNLNLDEVKQEHQENEARMDVADMVTEEEGDACVD